MACYASIEEEYHYVIVFLENIFSVFYFYFVDHSREKSKFKGMYLNIYNVCINI